MILVVCVDDNMGLALFGRRQSRDKLLIADLTALAAGEKIYMSPRSAMLFENSGANIIPHEDFASMAKEGEYCFNEFISPATLAERAEKIILYRWNRRYQADLFFDIDMRAWKLESSTDFPGSSHEKITREVYIHE